jgi:regulator of sigma D
MKQKDHWEQQANFAKLQVDEHKKIYEKLVAAFSSTQAKQSEHQFNTENRNDSILETNKNLSSTISRVEARN